MPYKAVAFYRESISSSIIEYDLYVGTHGRAEYVAALHLNRLDDGVSLKSNNNAGLLFLNLGLSSLENSWGYLLDKRADKRNIELPSDFAEKLYTEAEIAFDEGDAAQGLERVLKKERTRIEVMLSGLMPTLYHEKVEAKPKVQEHKN